MQRKSLNKEWIQASLVALVKNLPGIEETWVRALSREDPWEKGMATHSIVFLPGEFHGKRTWRALIHGVTKSRI